MSITFIGPSGSCEFPWVQCALLRDNVLHHFERLNASAAFSELHRAAEVVSGRAVTAPALRLREQLARAQALCLLPVSKLAISTRTKAILFGKNNSLPEPPTEIVGRQLPLPWVGENTQTLGDIFGNVCAGLLHITSGASETDMVEVLAS